MTATTDIQTRFAKHGQGQVFQFWDSLSAEQQKSLVSQLEQIDPERLNGIYKKATDEAKRREVEGSHSKMEPLPNDCYDSTSKAPAAKVKEWREKGLNAIAEGKVGVLLLAGGQGTRLGSSAPKGCYDIGLPSHKSLFQIQAERILRLEVLAKESKGKGSHIPWYVMTSGPTRADTEAFFAKHNYFGMEKKNVIFFEQGVLPALTMDGKIILEDKEKVSVAPDGNGGVYAALRTSGVLQDMQKRGLLYIHAYCVDNCLVRVADPTFIGYCITKKSDVGAKVVPKAHAHEPVGVICKVNGKWGVVEYSEISKDDAEKTNPDGSLAYGAGNIANHFYTLSFLEKCCTREFESQLEYHIAHKKIKYVDEAGKQISPSKPNGMKLELFIFDIFPFVPLNAFSVLSVPREDEFSPLKNAPGAGVDCPETSRRDIMTQCQRFLEHAGAKIDASGPGARVALPGVKGKDSTEEQAVTVELSPAVTYDGEGLESVVKGKTVKAPLYAQTLEDLKKALV